MTDNYIYRFLRQSNQIHLAEEFNLMPFEITVQTIERTLVDKVFALCDYYMAGNTDRHSRHLYDIHKILENTILPESFVTLIGEVRALRAPFPICPSAAGEININCILREIINKSIYKQDYKQITENLLFSPVSYETAISSLQYLVDGHYFE